MFSAFLVFVAFKPSEEAFKVGGWFQRVIITCPPRKHFREVAAAFRWFYLSSFSPIVSQYRHSHLPVFFNPLCQRAGVLLYRSQHRRGNIHRWNTSAIEIHRYHNSIGTKPDSNVEKVSLCLVADVADVLGGEVFLRDIWEGVVELTQGDREAEKQCGFAGSIVTKNNCYILVVSETDRLFHISKETEILHF